MGGGGASERGREMEPGRESGIGVGSIFCREANVSCEAEAAEFRRSIALTLMKLSWRCWQFFRYSRNKLWGPSVLTTP